jgi:predicted secreted protein
LIKNKKNLKTKKKATTKAIFDAFGFRDLIKEKWTVVIKIVWLNRKKNAKFCFAFNLSTNS